jgi:hypothetical protein
MAKVINFEEFEYAWHVTCPECDSDVWFIVLDRPDNVYEQAIQLQCVECGYTLGIQNDR